MSYLRGPMTKSDLARLKGAGGATAAPKKTPAESAAPTLPSAWPARWLEKRNADIASPTLFVKYAVRFRSGTSSAPELTAAKLFPLTAGSPAEVLEADALDLGPSGLDSLKTAAPGRPLRYADLPAWLGDGTVKAVEKAVRSRLPDKLATMLLRDPVTGALSGPGESAEDFAKRVAASTEAPAALREKLEKKQRDLAAAEASEQGRSMETMASIGTAALDVLGGLLGKRKSLRVGKVGSVLTKHRMEGTAESKVEGLKAEVAALEAKLAPPDASRFERVNVVPAAAHVDVLSIGVAWVC
jgi:hypothetical protein